MFFDPLGVPGNLGLEEIDRVFHAEEGEHEIQAIAEYLEQKGFDGIVYPSSVSLSAEDTDLDSDACEASPPGTSRLHRNVALFRGYGLVEASIESDPAVSVFFRDLTLDSSHHAVEPSEPALRIVPDSVKIHRVRRVTVDLERMYFPPDF